jgi:Ca2+-binding RTX toxin-like protein
MVYSETMATINGTDQSETLNGTENNDSISSGNGNDTIYGGDGDDWINGYINDEGKPLYYAISGTSLVYAGGGNDVVFGSNPSGASVVDLLYKNLVGSSAPQSVIDEYGGMLDNGSMTATELGIAVADHSLNATNIDLVGLAQTGVEYILYG